MTSGSKKKKKRKAAKKKKKKNSKGININSPPNFQGEDVDLTNSCGNHHNGLIIEEIGISSVGLDSESKSMEGSADSKSEAVPVSRNVTIEAPVETVKDLSDGGSQIVEKIDSLEKLGSAKLKEVVETVSEAVPSVSVTKEAVSSTAEKVIKVDPQEKAVSVSEVLKTAVSDEIPIVKATVSDVVTTEKPKFTDAIASASKDIKDRVVSVSKDIKDKVASVSKEIKDKVGSGSAESSENQENAPSTTPLVERSTWKSCCGLFDVVSGSNR